MESTNSSNFDEILANIKEEFDPFSLMGKSVLMKRPITVIPFNISSQMIKLEPINFDEKDKFDQFSTSMTNQQSSTPEVLLDRKKRPKTVIPFNIFSAMIKLEPINFDDHETNFEEIAINGNVKKRKHLPEKSKSSTIIKRARVDEKESKKCTVCNYENSLKCVIVRHIKLHSLPGVIKCDKCLVLCSNNLNMRLHQKRNH